MGIMRKFLNFPTLLCCVTLLTCSSGQSDTIYETFDNDVLDFEYPRNNLSNSEAIVSIKLTTEPGFDGDFRVNGNSFEIDILAGKKLEEIGELRTIHKKYFGDHAAASPEKHQIMTLSHSRETLPYVKKRVTVQPKGLGAETVKYEYYDNGEWKKGYWTVFSIPTVVLPCNAYFEKYIDFFNATAKSESLAISGMPEMSIDVDNEKQKMLLYGFSSCESIPEIVRIEIKRENLVETAIKLLLVTVRRPGNNLSTWLDIYIKIRYSGEDLKKLVDSLRCVADAYRKSIYDFKQIQLKIQPLSKDTMELWARFGNFSEGAGLDILREKASRCKNVIRLHNVPHGFVESAKTTTTNGPPRETSGIKKVPPSVPELESGNEILTSSSHKQIFEVVPKTTTAIPSTVESLSTTKMVANTSISEVENNKTSAVPEDVIEKNYTSTTHDQIEKLDSSSFGSYTSLSSHLRDYAALLAIVFVILFLLILMLSR